MQSQAPRVIAAAVALTVGFATYAQQDVLPNIPAGTISVQLTPVATGLGAPLYGVAPPNDPSRLFVLDQNGLVRVLQNGTMLSTPALDTRAEQLIELAALFDFLNHADQRLIDDRRRAAGLADDRVAFASVAHVCLSW